MTAAFPTRGVFVALEGIESSGKSTLIKIIAAKLEARGVPVRMTREPGGTPFGAGLRSLLLADTLTPRTEALLFAADRAEHVSKLIAPLLSTNMVVLCDRYETSSVVYQGLWRNLGVDAVRDISRFASDGLVPDITVWCRLDPDVAASRRGEHPDALDEAATRDGAILAEGFAAEAVAQPDRFHVIDTSAEPGTGVDALVDRIEDAWLAGVYRTRAHRPGRLVLIAGPSGSGKNTVLDSLLAAAPNQRWYSVSATTRPLRAGETDGVDYHFISEERFAELVETDGFLEHAAYAGFRYGTLAAPVAERLAAGVDVFAVVELEGVRQIRERHPDALTVFLTPPSDGDLEARLRARGTEQESQIQLRLTAARAEMMHGPSVADYTVCNRELDRTVELFERLLG
jgi:guanylate kinase/dTMP kinase